MLYTRTTKNWIYSSTKYFVICDLFFIKSSLSRNSKYAEISELILKSSTLGAFYFQHLYLIYGTLFAPILVLIWTDSHSI